MAKAPQRVRTRQAPSHQDPRVQHELKELQETHDLRDIDDDVEDIATLFSWQALEHRDHPKSPRWFAVITAGTIILTAFFLLTANFIAAITTAFLGGLVYYFAGQHPTTLRYRIMTDGLAQGTTLYHYRELDGFNIIYEPGETKVLLLRSKRRFSPLLTFELGDTDPVHIRQLLLQFLPEDHDLEEPIVDGLARRVGF